MIKVRNLRVLSKMKKKVKNIFRILLTLYAVFFMGGCHYENGRWYVGESDLVTLPDFRGEVDKLHDCLVADESVSAKEFGTRFKKEYERVTSDENWKYWGYLVCLAFNEQANQKQIGKTVVFLTDQIEPGNRAHYDLEAMSILLKKLLDHQNESDSLQQIVKEEKKKNMMQRVNFEIELLAKKKKIKDLGDQVRKLKEIEILLENNSKQ